MNILLLPPITFLIFLILGIGISKVTALLSPVGTDSEGKDQAYACGQVNTTHDVRPDYSQFFPYAFFFTVMHVLVLVVTTVPAVSFGQLALPALFIGVAVVSLVILFRR